MQNQITRQNPNKRTLLLLSVALLPGLAFALAKAYPQPSPTQEPHRQQPLLISPLPPQFLQHDKRWGKQLLGQTQETLSDSGCTLTCVAMALSHGRSPITPGQLNHSLRAHNGFTKRGWLLWSAIGRLTQQKRTAIVAASPKHSLIDAQLKRNKPVIAKIRLHGWAQHWVLLVGKRGSDYLLFDPLVASKTPRPLSSYNSRIHSIRWIE